MTSCGRAPYPKRYLPKMRTPSPQAERGEEGSRVARRQHQRFMGWALTRPYTAAAAANSFVSSAATGDSNVTIVLSV
jgi:hypothetical protein